MVSALCDINLSIFQFHILYKWYNIFFYLRFRRRIRRIFKKCMQCRSKRQTLKRRITIFDAWDYYYSSNYEIMFIQLSRIIYACSGTDSCAISRADNKYAVRWNIVLASYMGAAMFASFWLLSKVHSQSSIHCPFQHKDFSNGLNIYFSEQYEISSTPTVNVYYWFLYNKHRTQCIWHKLPSSVLFGAWWACPFFITVANVVEFSSFHS
jgi:hypothetical protein